MPKTTSKHRPLALLGKLIVSSRPISWINTAFPFAAGYLALGGPLDEYFFVALFYFLIPYNVLIYVVNDVFDYESDKRNPRKNSIEGGLLPPELHGPMLRMAAVVNIVPLGYLLTSGSLVANGALLLLALTAVSYSMPPLRLKERPGFDSINSSLHFVGPLLFAFVLLGWSTTYLPYVFSFFLWGCASHAFGAVQDIVADRQAGIHSIATSLGAKITVRLSLLLYALSVASVLFAGWPSIIVAAPLLLYVHMVWPYRSISDIESTAAHRGWRTFLLLNQVTGFTVTILLILGALR